MQDPNVIPAMIIKGVAAWVWSCQAACACRMMALMKCLWGSS